MTHLNKYKFIFIMIIIFLIFFHLNFFSREFEKYFPDKNDDI